jgi:predicted HTH domain antitoxin
MSTTTLSIRVPSAEAAQWARLASQVGLDRATLLKQALREGCSEVLLERAGAAYRKGHVSLSRAAEMAGVSLRDMMIRLHPAGLTLNYGVDDLAEDMRP